MATSTFRATSTPTSFRSSDQLLNTLTVFRLKSASAAAPCRRRCTSRPQTAESSAGSADAAMAEESKLRRASRLKGAGTLTGEQAYGKDPGLAALGKSLPRDCGRFQDARWVSGTWDIHQFAGSNGKVDWDAVIDAEVCRRKWLEDNPEVSLNEDEVTFRMSEIPWWAWMKRFHLPEAELVNGRAAMVGFFVGYVVDGLMGAGLIDQTRSVIGKALLFACVVGVLVIRRNEDVEALKQLAQEWISYDKQWQSSWQDIKQEGLPSLKAKE